MYIFISLIIFSSAFSLEYLRLATLVFHLTRNPIFYTLTLAFLISLSITFNHFYRGYLFPAFLLQTFSNFTIYMYLPSLKHYLNICIFLNYSLIICS